MTDRVSELRVAGIVDEFSALSFSEECDFLNLSRDEVLAQLESFSPQVLFVESAWRGEGRSWDGAWYPFVHPDLVSVVTWCRRRGIPTIYWAKEDPLHLYRYVGAAKLFDHVLTTELDTIPLYRELLGHNRVDVFPFAGSARLFTPFVTHERKHRACFAGSYYSAYSERCADIAHIFDDLSGFSGIDGFDIYDRNEIPDDPRRAYPERMRASIIGSLPPDQIDLAYKGYDVAITLNILKRYSTMEARRVFELLLSNTLTISNECLGITCLLGDTVLSADSEGRYLQRLTTLMSDKTAARKLRLIGMRKVLSEHTWSRRFEFLYELVFGKRPRVDEPKIAVIVGDDDSLAAENARRSFDRQTYLRRTLCVVPSGGHVDSAVLDECDYIAVFEGSHYYGEHYLEDLVAARAFGMPKDENGSVSTSPSVIGKAAYYRLSDEGDVEDVDANLEYTLVDRLLLDRSIVSSEFAKGMGADLLSRKYVSDYEGAILGSNRSLFFSVDMLSFCEGTADVPCTVCPKDLAEPIVDTGFTMDEVYDSYCDGTDGWMTEGHFEHIGKTVNLMTGDAWKDDEFVLVDGCNLAAYDFRILPEKRRVHLWPDLTIEGSASMTLSFHDARGFVIKKRALYPRCGVQIDVPEGAVTLSLRIKARGEAKLFIERIVLNVIPCEGAGHEALLAKHRQAV